MIETIINLSYKYPVALAMSSTFLWVLGFICYALAALCALRIVQGLWRSSSPNEWLLVIENGQQKTAGVGFARYCLPTQTTVKFPSSLRRVFFEASNVTKEFQGIKVSGFVNWKVLRELDGPFRFYKYIQGSSGDTNIRILCESLVRH